MVSTNTLPAAKDNVDNIYGDTVKWTVSFHRQIHWNQRFGVYTDDDYYGFGQKRFGHTRYSIDGNGRYIREYDEDAEYWYLPKPLPKIETWNGKPVDIWNKPPATIEVYEFEWNIKKQTMAIYDPDGRMMGPISAPYTWWLGNSDKWHLWVACKESYKTRLGYEFKDPNAQ